MISSFFIQFSCSGFETICIEGTRYVLSKGKGRGKNTNTLLVHVWKNLYFECFMFPTTETWYSQKKVDIFKIFFFFFSIRQFQTMNMRNSIQNTYLRSVQWFMQTLNDEPKLKFPSPDCFLHIFIRYYGSDYTLFIPENCRFT